MIHCHHANAPSTGPNLILLTVGPLRQTVSTPSGGRFGNRRVHGLLGQAAGWDGSETTVGGIAMWRSRLANSIGGLYHGEMAKKLPSRRRSSTATAFFDLLGQMEALTMTADLDWPADIRADAQRRLNRLARALRHAPETRERFDL